MALILPRRGSNIANLLLGAKEMIVKSISSTMLVYSEVVCTRVLVQPAIHSMNTLNVNPRRSNIFYGIIIIYPTNGVVFLHSIY